ncbi:hypothetical protein HPP92_001346 [Vanilla planifolia]|uniref:Uncharacterized protein n=1 Tax=Vanilla planifolia TaxID=51239 RepID=A0A835RZN4_VANPL|nr:hypothetical protein HPP92_001346 [Vanilla planifolia]
MVIWRGMSGVAAAAIGGAQASSSSIDVLIIRSLSYRRRSPQCAMAGRVYSAGRNLGPRVQFDAVRIALQQSISAALSDSALPSSGDADLFKNPLRPFGKTSGPLLSRDPDLGRSAELPCLHSRPASHRSCVAGSSSTWSH